VASHHIKTPKTAQSQNKTWRNIAHITRPALRTHPHCSACPTLGTQSQLWNLARMTNVTQPFTHNKKTWCNIRFPKQGTHYGHSPQCPRVDIIASHAQNHTTRHLNCSREKRQDATAMQTATEMENPCFFNKVRLRSPHQRAKKKSSGGFPSHFSVEART